MSSDEKNVKKDSLQTSTKVRSARLASLPLSLAGRSAVGLGKQLIGQSNALVSSEIQEKTARQVFQVLGELKGGAMKLGQALSVFESVLPDDVAGPYRESLTKLQDSAPPMAIESVHQVLRESLGDNWRERFASFDDEPAAAASIGQVHRAVIIDPITGEERAVAVKVQYPGVDKAIDADLRNADFLGALLQQGFSGLDPSDMVQEVKERIREELDYSREATNQQLFADYYRGHPYISVPEVMPTFSTSRVLTTELVNGMSFAELMQQDQEQKNLTGECLFRFVFRSLYGMHKFNGDPHPGNYIFHEDGRVTFLDFGLVKHFSDSEMNTFISMVKSAAYESDIPAFRSVLENAGMLQRDAPVETADVGTYFGRFYEPVREDQDITWTPEYSSGIVRHTFDRSSPIAQYATVPKPFVFIQRINLGLYAILGELGASGNYRRISQEIWPFADGEPSTEMGRREAEWLAQHG